MATTPSALDRLENLSNQRTARTDRLLEATHELCGRLDKLCKVGDHVSVAGRTLGLVRVHSNVALGDFWRYHRDEDERACYLDEGLDSRRYLHGDFHCQVYGPSRADLIDFANHAPALIEALVAKLEREGAALDAGATTVERIAEAL